MSQTLSATDTAAATARAIEVLKAGRLVVLPTDTVYTVVADAFQTFATQRLFGAKRRSRDMPLSLLIRNPRQVVGLARDVPETAERLMASYWPGPLSLLLPAQPDMPWELGSTGDAIGLRMPADDLVLAIAAEIGPLACSAANRRGEPPATTVDEAQLQLGDTVDLYLDGGPCAPDVTTVVDCTREGVHVLREGLVATADVLKVAVGDVGWGDRPASSAATPATEVDSPGASDPEATPDPDLPEPQEP